MAVYKRYKGKRIKHGSKDYNKATWVAEGTRNGIYYKESLKDAKTREDAVQYELTILSKISIGDYDFHKDRTNFSEYVEKNYLPRIKTDNESWGNNKKYQIPRLLNFFGQFSLKQISRKLCEDYREMRRTQTIPCQKCLKFKPTCFRCSGEKPRYKPPCWACKKRIAEVEEHRGSCKPQKVKNSTVNRDLVTLSDILTDAVIDHKIKENPMKFVKLLTEDDPRDRILSPDEKERLFAAFSDKEHSAINRRLWALVLIASTTSWREGRIMKLQKEHLDYETYTVWVSKSKQDKSKYVPVSRVTWSVLDSLANEVESGYLFRNSRTGEPLKCFPYDSWRALLKRAGIFDLTFHDLRHQAATDLYNLGAKLFGIQNALGHKRITTTQRYVAVADEGLREDLENLGDTYQNYLM